MGADDALVAVLADKFAEYRPHADAERGWRLYLGSEGAGAGRAAGVRAGRGGGGDCEGGRGVAGNGRWTGWGVLACGAEPLPGRSRRPGAGRPEAGKAQPGLREAFLQVVEEGTRGYLMTEITWRSLAAAGHRGPGCQGEGFLREGRGRAADARGGLQPAVAGEGAGGQAAPWDWDAQFRHSAAKDRGVQGSRGARDQRGHQEEGAARHAYWDGQTWRPKGDPVKVRDHDFPMEPSWGTRPRMGSMTLPRTGGSCRWVGTSCDTGAFRGERAAPVVAAGRRRPLPARHPAAGHLAIPAAPTAPAARCGKTSWPCSRRRPGCGSRCAHFPPATSKWNKIEHRMFCHVTRTWRGRPSDDRR